MWYLFGVTFIVASLNRKSWLCHWTHITETLTNVGTDKCAKGGEEEITHLKLEWWPEYPACSNWDQYTQRVQIWSPHQQRRQRCQLFPELAGDLPLLHREKILRTRTFELTLTALLLCCSLLFLSSGITIKRKKEELNLKTKKQKLKTKWVMLLPSWVKWMT